MYQSNLRKYILVILYKSIDTCMISEQKLPYPEMNMILLDLVIFNNVRMYIRTRKVKHVCFSILYILTLLNYRSRFVH